MNEPKRKSPSGAQLPLPADKLSNLNAGAQAELELRVREYAERVVQEAERLEANQTGGTANPEITTAMIRDADYLLARGYVRPRRATNDVMIQVGAYVAAVAAGVGGNALGETWGVVVFITACVVGTIAIATLEVRRR